MFLFRLFIFFIGVAISTTAGVWVYEPVDTFVDGVESVYLKVRAFEDTI